MNRLAAPTSKTLDSGLSRVAHVLTHQLVPGHHQEEFGHTAPPRYPVKHKTTSNEQRKNNK